MYYRLVLDTFYIVGGQVQLVLGISRILILNIVILGTLLLGVFILGMFILVKT